MTAPSTVGDTGLTWTGTVAPPLKNFAGIQTQNSHVLKRHGAVLVEKVITAAVFSSSVTILR